MRDKRPVDELSIEELERILAIRKREARQKQLRRMSEMGRRVVPPVPVEAEQPPVPEPAAETDSPAPQAAVAHPTPPPAVPPAAASGVPRFEDEYALESGGPADQAIENRAFWRMVWNRTLVLIEVAAFVGLVVIGVQMVLALQNLQAETAAIQAEAQAQAFAGIPTPSVTPEIDLHRIVLPSGHTPPTEGRSAQFNYTEIPEHLRPLVQQQMAVPITIPTPGPESPARIQIPRINVDAPIISGTDWESLKRGVGHQIGTGMPGQRGNLVLSAHNDIYGEIFRYLDQLEPGDEIIVSTLSQRYTYVVREWQVVTPTDVWVMDTTHNPTTTLISCYPYQVDNQRIVVFADLQVG